jgi:hypothetical protein
MERHGERLPDERKHLRHCPEACRHQIGKVKAGDLV